MKVSPHTGYLLSVVLLFAPTAKSLEDKLLSTDAYITCFNIPDDIKRLSCYDRLIREVEAVADSSVRLDGSRKKEYTVEDVLSQRTQQIAYRRNQEKREQRGLLQSDDPNYIVYASPYSDDLGDESHAEIYISLKYPLVRSWFTEKQEGFRKTGGTAATLGALIPDRWYLHYNGLYDFYAWSDKDWYGSSPVISRRQNPGTSFEWDLRDAYGEFRLGWFHESNGQQLEKGDMDEFDKISSEDSEDYALSQVSRGWDYAMARLQYSTSSYPENFSNNTQFTYNVEMRWFCDCQAMGFQSKAEDEIWWEENNSDKISDYDGLRGMTEWSYRTPLEDTWLNTRLELKTGLYNSPFEHVTGKLSLGVQSSNLRLTFFYFDGYGRDPSTYNIRTKYFGAGLELR